MSSWGANGQRAAAQLSGDGRFQFTETDAYSGDNGRAAIAAEVGGKELIYASGNAGNGSSPQPTGVILGAGAQLITPSDKPEAAQSPDTLYVADEGNGTNTYSGGDYTAAAAQTTAGLQKWVFDGTQWQLAYTLQAGLDLGQPYTVRGYPTGDNAATGLPWAPATDGLRNGGGDQGADPNKLVEITDPLSASAPAAAESFRTVRAAGFGEVLRGVSFTPGTRS
jgi:hypothetical protein